MHDIIDFELKNISKIEGHTHLDLRVKNGKTEYCKLKISEGKRFFTNAITGMDYKLVPTTMSRICGTCSSAHALCSIEAIEKAFNLEVTEQTLKLRKLLANAGHLRDHAMHLYFFVLPDIIGKDSVLDFTGKEKEWIHDGLHVKEAGNFLSTIIGGRAVHPPNLAIGGFTKFPEKQEMLYAIKKLEECRNNILNLIEVLYNNTPKFERKTNYVAMINNDYSFLKGYIKTAMGTSIFEEDYGNHLKRVVLPYSTATAFKWESKDFMVGAMARLNLNKEHLHTDTIKDTFKYLQRFPSNNIFDNNLAQGIEMLHQIDSSIEILDELKEEIKQETIIQPKIKKSEGVGVVEAPRGTLYYNLKINEKGIVTYANLCIPTQQNIIHLEKDIGKYVEELLQQKKNKEYITKEIEKMIRAYDPCMSCATHFLKINWI